MKRGIDWREPLRVLIVATGGPDPIVTHLRNLIVIEEGAAASVVEDRVSLGEGTSFTNVVTEVVVGVNARGRHTVLERQNCESYAVSTVQEEVGLRGARTSAFGVDPHVGVAVDVTHATDCPTVDKKQEGEIGLGDGPVIYRGPNMNPSVVTRLIATADKNEIPHQLAADGRPTGTDANAIQITRAGVATGLVSIPNRYMHSPVEMISLEDIDRAADLLARFVEGLTADADFTP